ncbi:hypothetical protein BDA99DRAFT_152122 [Phascolomyces articulosus]|uniref:Uncharacterized protein n=1 Tax=Phascolomyces articulosus TaxID=60185 RepID=A0AAD5JUE4_9FUNG|nr:hypothetical protein BDA99DRAFT_152122 [Phascolomyces articulosus]
MTRHPTPNLELFSFNDKIDGPPLPMLQDYSEKTMKDDLKSKKGMKKQGLRVLYTSYGESPVLSEYFIPLLYKHQETLENVRGCLSSLSESQVQGFYEKYSRFKLENLKHLATWLEPGIQDFMLHTAIRGTNKISSITAVGGHDLELFLTTLMDRASLDGLNLSHMYWSGVDTTLLLIQVFNKYAKLSSSSNKGATDTTTPGSAATSLKWIKLRYCNPMVTDKVLMSLTGIKTLHDIHLGGLTSISTWGMVQMIQKLDSQITHVFLHDMFLVTDSIIVALGNLDNLPLVKLELLEQVTNLGIRALVDKKMMTIQKLVTLEVTECKLITQDCIRYAMEKVKTVRYNSPYSEYYMTKAKNGYYVSRSAWIT